jgi:acyl-CoA thioesterase-1
MRLKFRLLAILLCCFAAAAPAWAGQEAAIVILGDSLSAAFGMEMRQSWPSLLQDRLEEDGHAYRVFNSSIAGDTTQGGLTRLPRLLETHRPAIVLIELGGNDGLRGLPVDVTRRNLSDMIEQSQAAGARVIVAEMRIPPNYGRTYTEKFNETYRTLQQRYGIVLLPFVLQEIALQQGLMLDDGIHPTAEAQPLILDQVWAVLEPLL